MTLIACLICFALGGLLGMLGVALCVAAARNEEELKIFAPPLAADTTDKEP